MQKQDAEKKKEEAQHLLFPAISERVGHKCAPAYDVGRFYTRRIFWRVGKRGYAISIAHLGFE